MMDNFSFQVPGLAAFEQQLIALGSTVARQGGRAALRQATNVITAEARLQALPHKLTGLTIKSIRTVDKGIRGDTVMFATAIPDAPGLAFYARFVEYGHGNVPPYPFMRPAAEIGARESSAVLAATLGSWLALQWGRPL